MKGPLFHRNRRMMVLLAAAGIGMVGLTYASVPLYQLFCQVTGYGGTPRTAQALPEQVLDRQITVRFNADISRSMPWRFRPAQKQISLKIGEQGLAFYKAKNMASEPVTGTASYNVTPLKAGAYFNKIDCFCFTEQILAPDQEIDMPVTFYIDPAIHDDPNMQDVTTITLSYTFFALTGDAEGKNQGKGRQNVSGRAIKPHAPTGNSGVLTTDGVTTKNVSTNRVFNNHITTGG